MDIKQPFFHLVLVTFPSKFLHSMLATKPMRRASCWLQLRGRRLDVAKLSNEDL